MIYIYIYTSKCILVGILTSISEASHSPPPHSFMLWDSLIFFLFFAFFFSREREKSHHFCWRSLGSMLRHFYFCCKSSYPFYQWSSLIVTFYNPHREKKKKKNTTVFRKSCHRGRWAKGSHLIIVVILFEPRNPSLTSGSLLWIMAHRCKENEVLVVFPKTEASVYNSALVAYLGNHSEYLAADNLRTDDQPNFHNKSSPFDYTSEELVRI